MTNENTENHSIPVRLTDILHFKSLSNLSLSLDGTRAAFMIHQCNGAQDGYNSNLWIYDLSRGRTVQVTSGNKKQIFLLDTGRLACLCHARRRNPLH